MKLLLCDITQDAFSFISPAIPDNIKIIYNNNKIHSCLGCFGCWLKTPGTCVIKDGYENMAELLSKSDEVVIISQCMYGTYSPFIRNILDRCLPYLLPYFEKQNGETHHKPRYPSHHFKLTVLFYGLDITNEEKNSANKLVVANSIVFHSMSVVGWQNGRDSTVPNQRRARSRYLSLVVVRKVLHYST